jgi:DNA-binding CsgD family transcriptional regulator
MASQKSRPAGKTSTVSPRLPLAADHWAAVILEIGLSPRQVRIVELVLCDHSNKEIGRILRIGEPTVKTYLDRIAARTGTRGRMQLAMHVLAVSHRILGNGKCPPTVGVQPSGCPTKRPQAR